MDRNKKVADIISISIYLVLMSLIVIAVTSDIPISLKCFAVSSAIYGFYEVHKLMYR